VDDQGRLRVRVRAAPDGGAANKAILRTLADALDVAPSTVVLVAGASSRVKRVELDVAPSVLSARWPGLLTREE
jgi:uncharacterized protein YggU (UPF0235/DUF167 family)